MQVSESDSEVDHTARRLIVEVQTLVERLQTQLEHLDARVREDTRVVRHTLTLIGDEIFQDQRRRTVAQQFDLEARTTRQKELDTTLVTIQRIQYGIVILLSIALVLYIGARWL